MKRYGIALFCLLLSLPVFADQLIIEPDMGQRPVMDAINKSKQSLQLVMYGFTDQNLLNALLAQKAKGRSLQIILERRPYKADDENTKTIRLLDKHQVAWHGNIRDMRLIHQKTLLTDSDQAMVMTFNFTHSTFDQKTNHPQRNFALVIDNPQTVKAIAAVFASDWNNQPTYPGNLDLIYSPNDSRGKLITLMEKARQHIRIYAQSVTDYKFIGALASAARSGINVEILTSRGLEEKAAAYLAKAGVHVHLSSHYYIHAKVMIIDDQLAVIGSINLTRASLDDNRELSVITRDPGIINTLIRTFNADL